jgi:RNA polymerase-binding transcription factor
MDKQHLKKKILDELNNVKNDIIELEDQTKPISPENSLGRISRMDAINNKSVVEASLRHAKDKHKKLEIALEQFDDISFGICVRCKQPIPEGRIMLMPHIKKCVNCA